MTTEPTEHPPFEWIGGHTCLDFANTVSWIGSAHPNERLGSYGDLLEWADQAEVLDQAALRRLRRAARSAPAAADVALRSAQALREAIHEVFLARAEGREPEAAASGTLNRFLGQALGRLRLQVEDCACSWVFVDEGDELERMLWPVAWSAASLLTSEEAQLVRCCAAERCGWLFLDRSRNRSRRWCDMKACGNSAKARRHYARTRRLKRAGLEQAPRRRAEAAGIQQLRR
jgi:predicted RNA-binding Zn ribbon-like protein